MKNKNKRRDLSRNPNTENEFRCDNIFQSAQKQPYLETTQAGKWGRGKDDSPVNPDEYPNHNNPLPY